MTNYYFEKVLNTEEQTCLLQWGAKLSPAAFARLDNLGRRLANRDPSMAVYLFRIAPKVFAGAIDLNRQLELMEKYLTSLPFQVGIVFLQQLQRSPGGEAAELWAQLGYQITCFAEEQGNWYFQNSVDVLSSLPDHLQASVLNNGLNLSRFSPGTAISYFNRITDVVELGIDPVDKWFQLGLCLTNISAELGRLYFQTSPLLLNGSTLDDLDWVVKKASLMAKKHHSLSGSFITAAPELVQYGDNQFWKPWVDKSMELADVSVNAAKSFWSGVARVLKYIKVGDLEKWLAAGKQLTEIDGDLGALFFQSGAEVLQYIEPDQLQDWVELGLQETERDISRLKAYFSLSGSGGREGLSSLRKGLELGEVKTGLQTFAQGLSGESLVIRVLGDLPELIHGNRRLWFTSDGGRLYVPDKINVFPDKDDNFLVYKFAVIHELAHRLAATYNPEPAPDNGYLKWIARLNNPVIKMLFSILEDGRVDRLMLRSHPGLAGDWQKLLDLSRSRKQLEFSSPALNFLSKLEYPWLDLSSASSFAVPREELCYLDKFVSGEATVHDSLDWACLIYKRLSDDEKRVLKSWQPLIYRGEIRPELWIVRMMAEDLIAAGQLNQLVPLLETVSNLGADLQFYRLLVERLETFKLDEEELLERETVLYDEWDCRIDDYRHQWCQVREILLKPSTSRPVRTALEENYGLIESLKKYFAILRPDRHRKYRKQPDGEELDLEALVETMTEVRVGETSGIEGFYIRRDRRVRDVAAAFLMDLSDSTDELVNQSGKTILAVEIEAVVVMAEALDTIGDQYGIYGFSSHGRDKVDFYVLKEFDEAFNERVRQRFGGLRSANATRLGAAIRHARNKLSKVDAAVKLLFVLSDGRPYDFDYCSPVERETDIKTWLRSEPDRYGCEDVRIALQELKMYGITPFALTVDRRGKEYLEEIFGQVNYLVMNRIEDLPVKLPEVYRRLTI